MGFCTSRSIVLRDVEEADLLFLFEQQLDPEATQMAALAPKDLAVFAAHWDTLLADHSVIKKVIDFDGEVAGHAVCFERHGRRLVGYWLGRQYWGQGFASWALGELLELVDERPLYAHVATHNLASIRVLEKSGFRFFGECPEVPNEEGVELVAYVLEQPSPSKESS